MFALNPQDLSFETAEVGLSRAHARSAPAVAGLREFYLADSKTMKE